MSFSRTRWAAVGAAIAVSLGAGGLNFVEAVRSDGQRSVFQPITPCRISDTRPAEGIGGRTSPVGPAESLVVNTRPDTGECAGRIPADATGVSLNITAVAATERTFLTVYPGGEEIPGTSTLNPRPESPRTVNGTQTGIDADGEFNIRNQFGSVHVIIDIAGFYIDHDHDDRYYPRADVDAMIATVDGEVLDPSGSGNIPFDFEFEREWPVDETATSSIAGRWQISKFFRGGTSCTPSNVVGRIFFLTVDDVPVESSMFYVSNSSSFSVMLSGITEEVIEPGEHVIGVGAECVDDNTSGSFSSLNFSSSSAVVVHPE